MERLYTTLLSMQKSVEGQLAARKEDMEAARLGSLAQGPDALPAWLDEKAKYAKWRAGSIRFKVGLEQALMEVRHLRDAQRLSRGLLFEDEASHRLNVRVQLLEAAIKKHREGFDDDDDPSDNDLELWAHLPEH